MSPCQRLLTRVQSIRPGARMVKAALAVALAWWVGTLLGEPRPMFAALGALVGMEPTIIGSLRRTGVQMVGTLGGIVLAYVAVNLLGVSWLGAGLAVLLGLWLGRWLGSPDRVGVELAVGALLIVGFASGDPHLGLTRLWEVLLGGLIATAINTLVLPPNYIGQVLDSLDELTGQMETGLREAGHELAEIPQHERAAETHQRVLAAEATLHDAQERANLAREALRLNPLLLHRRGQVDRALAAIEVYGRTLQHVLALTRILEDHADRPHPWSHGDLVGPSQLVQATDALARTLEWYQAYVRLGRPDPLAEARHELARAQAALQTFYEIAERERAASTPVRRLIDIAAFASELEHLAYRDLAAALDGASLAGLPACPSSGAAHHVTTP
jgi:uncharacterized membrane protein YgaE (UPF0421/DUF939 family)